MWINIYFKRKRKQLKILQNKSNQIVIHSINRLGFYTGHTLSWDRLNVLVLMFLNKLRLENFSSTKYKLWKDKQSLIYSKMFPNCLL